MSTSPPPTRSRPFLPKAPSRPSPFLPPARSPRHDEPCCQDHRPARTLSAFHPAIPLPLLHGGGILEFGPNQARELAHHGGALPRRISGADSAAGTRRDAGGDRR